MDNIKTGNLIKETRKEKGFTQKQLADLLHITDRAVSKWERGLSAPDIALLEPLACILELKVAELISGRKENENNSRDIENTVKNIIDYSEKQIEKKTNEVKKKLPIELYGVAIVVLFIAKSCMGFAMDRLSQYAGYYIYTGRVIGEGARLIFFWIMISSPVWGAVLMINWAVTAVEGGKMPSAFTSGIIHAVSIAIIVYLSYITISEGLHIATRYNHLVAKGSERYEMIQVDYAPYVTGYNNGRADAIVYICDEENPDIKTEEYLQDVISRQPLKIYKLEKKNSNRVMGRYYIKELPTVMIIRKGYADMLTGYDEIFLLESKIHKLKQENIYFY